jgi:type I restriction enzyme R subunit
MVKGNDADGIDKIREFLTGRIINVWESDLEAVRRKSEEIKRVLQEKFWQELTFEDIDFLIREIAPLMIYYEQKRKKIVRVNAPDFVLEVEDFKMQIKEDKRLEEFRKLPLVQKMIKEGVSWRELFQISKELTKLNPAWTIENIQRTQDFILFLRNVFDIKDLPDPEEIIKQEFEKLIMKENKNYNADQIGFLRMLSSFFAINKHLERRDFTVHPLADERPLEKFSRAQLDGIINKVAAIKIK